MEDVILRRSNNVYKMFPRGKTTLLVLSLAALYSFYHIRFPNMCVLPYVAVPFLSLFVFISY